MSQRDFAFFFEQGCGKTLSIIATLCGKYEQVKEEKPTLILCPQIVVENWKREILASTDADPNLVVCLTGSGKHRANTFINKVLNGTGKIVVTNYEGLLMGELFSLLLRWVKVLVLDESQKCKELTSKRTKLCVQLSRKCDFRLLASGTPIVNSEMDIFSQFLILDEGETFGTKLHEFKREYFVDLNAHMPRHCYFPNWKLRRGSEARLNEKIYKKAMRVKKAECLTLPPLVRQIVEFELSGEQKRAYKEMEQDAVSFIDDKVVSADLAIKKALRLQQIASGFVTEDSGGVHIFDNNPRINALEEVIESIPKTEKFIIWATFRQNYVDIRRLLSRMKIFAVELTGETSNDERQQNVDFFNNNPACRALLGHPRSGGIGVNLVSASYAIFYSRSFSLEDDLQAEARNHRGGSERHQKITRIDIVASGTVDEVALTALQDKQNVSEAILNHLKNK